MTTPFTLAAYATWCVLLLVWLPGYVMRKYRRAPGGPAYPALQITATALLLACFALTFSRAPPGLRLVVTPQTTVLGIIGLALDIVGIGFAIWARLTLGRNWSGVVMTVRDGQELVQTGPYAIVRHPIYTGLLVALLGTALTRGTLASYIGVAAGLVAVLIRVEIEERLMAAEFGTTHAAFRQRTRKLIPFVW